MRIVGCCAAVAISLALAACGGSSSSSSTTSPSAPTETTTSSSAPTDATTTASTVSTPSIATTTAGAPGDAQPFCAADALSLRFLGQQGASGHGELGFALLNVSRIRCHTFGFPGIQFFSRSGSALPTNAMHTTHDLFGLAPRVEIVVAPGASASFRIGVTHGLSSSAGCTTAYALQVIPPDDTASLRTAIPGGAYECGQATVSPLRPGDSAYP